MRIKGTIRNANVLTYVDTTVTLPFGHEGLPVYIGGVPSTGSVEAPSGRITLVFGQHTFAQYPTPSSAVVDLDMNVQNQVTNLTYTL